MNCLCLISWTVCAQLHGLSVLVLALFIISALQQYRMTQQPMRIGHYLLGKVIGSGGYARVREGRHELTGARVAVKIINKVKMKNKNMISKVKRQIRNHQALNHPNIIKLYEVLDTSADIFVVMELAPRGQLYEYLQAYDYTEGRARSFFSQVVEGLEWAHLHLVAHRDLKPQNILLDGNLNCKIADFGLSNLMKDGKYLRTSCGSINYAPPEILGHRAYEGTAVDVWSLGVILYTLLVGALPFEEEVVSLLYRKIEKAEYVIPEGVCPAARDLISRMIRADPLSRIRLREVKMHPWLRKTVPLYVRAPSFGVVQVHKREEVDQEVLEVVKRYDMESLRGQHNNERIKKMVRGKMDYSFVTAYQLLKDQKTKENRTAPQAPQKYLFLETTNSRLPRSREKGTHEYGRSFDGPLSKVFEATMTALKQMSIEYAIKKDRLFESTHEYWLECVYQVRGKARMNFGLQFWLAEEDRILVDLRLVKGHPLNFMNLSSRLYCSVSQQLR